VKCWFKFTENQYVILCTEKHLFYNINLHFHKKKKDNGFLDVHRVITLNDFGDIFLYLSSASVTHKISLSLSLYIYIYMRKLPPLYLQSTLFPRIPMLAFFFYHLQSSPFEPRGFPKDKSIISHLYLITPHLRVD